MLTKVASSPDLDGDTIEWIFVEDATTPDFDDTTPALLDITENTITTAGTYTTGGEPLASLNVAFNGTTHFMFDAADENHTGTTISAEGVIGFSETATSPSTDPLLWATDFTTQYSSNGGNFDITWDSNGIFRFSL
jgi:hypothetical protein